MAGELEPRGELPGTQTISFDGPSAETIDILDHRLRVGSDTKIELARMVMPDSYPFGQIAVTFSPFKDENSPHGRDDVPKHYVGYWLNVSTTLREETEISEETARNILSALQTNTGLGLYRQLPIGTHQIIIPGDRQVPITGSTVPHTYEQNPYEAVTTVLGLGVNNARKGIKRLEDIARWDMAYTLFNQERITEEKERLRSGSGKTLKELNIELVSNYLIYYGINEGDNYGLRGKRDRDFGITSHPSPHGEDSYYFGVYKGHVSQFFENATFLLQAVSEVLSKVPLPKVTIPIALPESNAAQEIPPVIRDFLEREEGF